MSRPISGVALRCRFLGLWYKRKGDTWTPQEDEIVLARRPGVPWKEVWAQLPGRTLKAVRLRDEHLRTRSTVTKRIPWTPEEDALLWKEQAAGASVEAISARLPGRTINACLGRRDLLRCQSKLNMRVPGILPYDFSGTEAVPEKFQLGANRTEPTAVGVPTLGAKVDECVKVEI
jgi:hypothetical protein